MAQMVPEKLPSKASEGEKRLFKFLTKLPETYIVYYEANVRGRNPDFIVIAPDLGLLVIEVKGWYLTQEKKARQFGEGHRIVAGVAGSGKTVMLIARAKHHLEEHPDHHVLVLCFNVCLSAYLGSCLKEFPNAKVIHFHGMASDLGLPFNPDLSDEEFGQTVLDRLEGGSSYSGAFDAVLIDEVQDYEPNWLRCALATIKNQDDGDLFIVGDGSQGLLNRGGFTWKSVGINVVGGRSQKLQINYRNTRQIAEVAELLSEKVVVPDESEQLAAVRIDPEKTRRTGPLPVLTKLTNREEECASAIRIVGELLGGKWMGKDLDGPLSPHEIGILYPRLYEAERELIGFLPQQIESSPGSPKAVWIRRDAQTDSRNQIGATGVKIQTIHSAKGLQYKAVILLFADMLGRSSDPELDASLLYVAMTRPEDMLVISYAGSSSWLNEIAKSGKVIVP